ncbi:MAG: Gfo/Idh/MocA family oxidoreductase [Bacteroidia bacterium]|nr:Gfo/Idh/MocA family oxidoreductase [Bacteroidia bacterium]
MKNFALLGAAGFIAPRHLKAIKDTGNQLLCALDKSDSVGILDSHFPGADFFTEFERFDRHVDKLRRLGKKIDYVSICTPSYLHDSHIRFALRSQANAICEKPLVLNPWNINALAEYQKEYDCSIYTILQLRLHPSIIALKKRIDEEPKDKVYDIDLKYITARGNWYHTSWKADATKSGGIATNIGVHIFDMLAWIFGEVTSEVVHVYQPNRAAGFLHLEHARVRWFLSIDFNDIPAEIKLKGQRTLRSLQIENEEIEFSDGFTGLHTLSYEEILAGRGFSVNDSKPGIEIVHQIRSLTPIGLSGDYHPYLKEISLHGNIQ